MKLALLAQISAAALLAGCAATMEAPKKVLLLGSSKDAPGGELIGETGQQREEMLRPNTVPDRVRYKTARDDVVAKSADLLKKSLGSDGIAPFSDMLMVFPGAWQDIQEIPGLSLTKAKPASFPRENSHIDKGMLFFGKTESQRIMDHIRVVVGHQPVIRTFTTAEVARWWIFIPFDIEEPIFVVESSDRSRRYVFSFSKKNEVILLDELSFYR